MSSWTMNETWTKSLPRKGVDQARDSNSQQLPQVSADAASSLAFPVIGAILILLFGGFLLSSGNSCCPVESTNKKETDDEYEEIELTTFFENVKFPKPLPVLQQENNDVVDAVMETYSDLPQYAPINELMATIPGIIRRPETRDACVSPMSCIGRDDVFLSNIDDVDHCHDNPQDTEFQEEEDEDKSKKSDSSISDEDVSNIEHALNDNNDDCACSSISTSSGFGSKRNTPAISIDSGMQDENMRDAENADSEHLQEIKRTLDASFGVELREKTLERPERPMNETFSYEETTISKHCTPTTRYKLNKWIHNTKESRDIVPKDNACAVPYQWKRPAKLTRQEKVEILRKLQPDLNATISPTVKSSNRRNSDGKEVILPLTGENVGDCIVSKHGGRLSCLKVVQAPTSMCIHGNVCKFNCNSSHVPNDVNYRDEDSGHGASFLGLSSRGSAESPRGASALIESYSKDIDSSGLARGASVFEGFTRGASGFNETFRYLNNVDDCNVRGASAFDETLDHLDIDKKTIGHLDDDKAKNQVSDNLVKSTPTLDLSTRGAHTHDKISRKRGLLAVALNTERKTLCDSTDKKIANEPLSNANEGLNQSVNNHGNCKSYFDCLSLAGTASVTLSMAVQSERDDFTLASIGPKQTSVTDLSEETRHEPQCNKKQLENDELVNGDKHLMTTRNVDFSHEKELKEKEHGASHEALPVKGMETADHTSNVDDYITDKYNIKQGGTHMVEVAAEETIPHDLVATSNKPRNLQCNDVNPCDLFTNVKVSSLSKRSMDFDPSRSSTPYQGTTTPKDSGGKTSAKGMRSKSPKLSLGRDPEALSGLLKALQKAKRKKECCSDEKVSKDTNSVNEKKCVTENEGFVANAENVTEGEGCMTKAEKVTASEGCVTRDKKVTEDENVAKSHEKHLVKTSDKTSEDLPDHSPQQLIKIKQKLKNIVGKIKVCLFYNNKPQKPVLYVTVLKASCLQDELVTQGEDLLVQLHVSSREDKRQQTKSVSKLANTAVFNHLFQVHDIKLDELQVSTINLVLVSRQKEEAIACIPLAGLASCDKIKKTYLLKKYSSVKNKVQTMEPGSRIPVGALHLGLKYNSVDEKLLVNVSKARGLPAVGENGETNPYVILTLMDDGTTIDEKVTCTKWKQRNPQFDASFVLEINRVRIATTSLLLRVMNNSANHSLIGAVNIGMDSTGDSGRQQWENVMNQDGVLDERMHKLLK